MLIQPLTHNPVYDDVISTIHKYGPNTRGGLFNHGPMVVEALFAMNLGNYASPWLEAELEHYLPRSAAQPETINNNNWEKFLGSYKHFENWSQYMQQSIGQIGWEEVLALWCSRLSTGFTTAACHGLLRTAHAARAISQFENQERRLELADALASWASMYTELPVSITPANGSLSAADALAGITPVPESKRPEKGMISAGFSALIHAPSFSDEVCAVDLSGPVIEAADDMVISFSRLFTQAVHTEFTAIVFAHTVTGAGAIHKLAPLLPEQNSRELMFRAWESGCALKAAFHGARVSAAIVDAKDISSVDVDCAGLARVAANSGDDHIIKLTETCLHTYRRRPDGILIQAIQCIREYLGG